MTRCCAEGMVWTLVPVPSASGAPASLATSLRCVCLCGWEGVESGVGAGMEGGREK